MSWFQKSRYLIAFIIWTALAGVQARKTLRKPFKVYGLTMILPRDIVHRSA